MNGYDAIAVTKLDILDDMDELKIGVTYKDKTTGETWEHFPSSPAVSHVLISFCL